MTRGLNSELNTFVQSYDSTSLDARPLLIPRGAGRRDEAVALLERLLSLRNDVGLRSEEWDPAAQRQLGITPQAFSHFALINSALLLHHGGAEHGNGAVGAPRPMSGSGL